MMPKTPQQPMPIPIATPTPMRMRDIGQRMVVWCILKKLEKIQGTRLAMGDHNK
jgi:hypothetical protein